MEGKEFVAKFKEILKKAGDAAERYFGYLVVSDDPDCDVDYGLDEQGYLVLDCKKSMFKVKDLEKIRYRALKESDDIGECYISLLFKNDRALYMYFGDEAMLGECIELYYNGRLVSEQIVFAVNYGWNGEDDLVITDDGSLVGYLGEEKNVILPENVVMIKKSAFEEGYRLGLEKANADFQANYLDNTTY